MSASSTPGAGPSSQPLLDPYRSLASAIQKPSSPFVSATGSAPTLQDVLGVNDTTYKDRVEGKTLVLDGSVALSGGTALVSGRKRNRGDPVARKAAREAADSAREKRESLGHIGLRKARKRGGVVNRAGMIDYESLLPLHYLHLNYLFSILSCPPLPTPLPSPLRLPQNLSQDAISAKLIKADFTGIHLSVLSSRNASLQGLSGIVIEETGATFRIVGEDSRVKVLPKEGTQFGLSFPAYAPPTSPNEPAQDGEDVEGDHMARHLASCPRVEIGLLGNNFGYRSGERAGRKFKLAQGEGGGNSWGEGWIKGDWTGILDDPAISASRTGSKKDEKGIGAGGMRKKGKPRRKDPFAGGSRQVVF